MFNQSIHCAFCGMPAVTFLCGTSTCNNAECQRRADTRQPGPEGIQTPHGPGVPRRVKGPNEVDESKPTLRKPVQGILRNGLKGLEVQSLSDPDNVLFLCPADELLDVITFLKDNYPSEWRELVTNDFLNPQVNEAPTPPLIEYETDLRRTEQ